MGEEREGPAQPEWPTWEGTWDDQPLPPDEAGAPPLAQPTDPPADAPGAPAPASTAAVALSDAPDETPVEPPTSAPDPIPPPDAGATTGPSADPDGDAAPAQATPGPGAAASRASAEATGAPATDEDPSRAVGTQMPGMDRPPAFPEPPPWARTPVPSVPIEQLEAYRLPPPPAPRLGGRGPRTAQPPNGHTPPDAPPRPDETAATGPAWMSPAASPEEPPATIATDAAMGEPAAPPVSGGADPAPVPAAEPAVPDAPAAPTPAPHHRRTPAWALPESGGVWARSWPAGEQADGSGTPTWPPDPMGARAESSLPLPDQRRAPSTTPMQNAPSTEEVPGEAWGQSVNQARRVDLNDLWAAGAFAGVRLSGADVYYLAALALTGPAGELEAAAYRLRYARHDAGMRFGLDLSALHLEGAVLEAAQLEGAALRGAHLRGVDLRRANLHRATLRGANLEAAQLVESDLRVANLEGATLRGARLDRADLAGAVLARANLRGAHLEQARLVLARLDGAHLRGAHLESANLAEARLDGAFLAEAMLAGANLYKAGLDGADLTRAHLEGANLRLATLGRDTQLREAHLDRATLGQVEFDSAVLTGVRWDEVRELGDETEARRPRSLVVVYAERDWRVQGTAKLKSQRQRRAEYQEAARAYWALTAALRAQGMSAQAREFHFRGELMQRYSLLHDFFACLLSPWFFAAPYAYARWLASWLLGTFVGYGDRIARLVYTYVTLIALFTLLYVVMAREPLTATNAFDALAYSVTSFHGHGLQAPDMFLDQALVAASTVESIIGLAMEALFVAALTRRLTAH